MSSLNNISIRKFFPVSFAELRPCSLALFLQDAFTNEIPINRPRILLQREWPSGKWTLVQDTPVVTPRGVLAYFKLEHRRSAIGEPPINYRFTIESDYYVPAFLETKDFETLQVPPYDDHATPPSAPTSPTTVLLYPSIAYPFEASVSLIRGKILDGAGRPTPNALVREGKHDRTLSDTQGRFALPVRWVSSNKPTLIDASDRLHRTGAAKIVLPESLNTQIVITVA